MHGFLRRHHWRFVVVRHGIKRLKQPGIGHDSECRSAFHRRRRGDGVGAELGVLRFRIVPVLGAGTFGLAQGLHQQAHKSPGGRVGMR